MFLKKGLEFQKLLMIVHILGEGEEITEISYDSPRFLRRKRNSRN